MSREKKYDSIFILQLLIAGFLIVLGLQEIIYYNSTAGQFSRFFSDLFGKSEYVFNLIFGILKVASGIIIAITAFGIIESKNILYLCVLIFLIVHFVFVHLIREYVFANNFLTALGIVLKDAIIIGCVWIGYNR
jgi:hypothetical protein